LGYGSQLSREGGQKKGVVEQKLDWLEEEKKV